MTIDSNEDQARLLVRDIDAVCRRHRAGGDVLLRALVSEVASTCLAAATLAALRAGSEPTQAVVADAEALFNDFAERVRACFAEADVGAAVTEARKKRTQRSTN